MKQTYLIFGYGIPKNIYKDENYNFYLKMVFNRIYDDVVLQNVPKPLLIFSGGKTDMLKPYKRTEADEMIRLVKRLANRKAVRDVTKHWKLIAERSSISTLENFLFCKKILRRKKIQRGKLTIFCEHTRERRVKLLAKKILTSRYDITIAAIDFDTSPNRYLDPEFLIKKERTELKHSLWALKSPENFRKHHKLFVEKLSYFRQHGPSGHSTAIRKFWETKLNELTSQK